MTGTPGDQPSWITVGVVAAAHGIRGEVRVKPLTDFPERFAGGRTVYLGRNGAQTPAVIVRVRDHGRGMLIVKLERVDDRNQAEALRGTEIRVPYEERAELPQDTYYVFELIGCRVEDTSGDYLGDVEDVLTSSGNDVYVVAKDGEEVLVPAVKEFVRSVDVERKRIVLAPPVGLF